MAEKLYQGDKYMYVMYVSIGSPLLFSGFTKTIHTQVPHTNIYILSINFLTVKKITLSSQ